MSRKVNLDIDVRAALCLPPGLTEAQLDDFHDQIAEGFTVSLPRVRKADVEDVTVSRLVVMREAVEMGAATDATPEVPDRVELTATLDVLVRAARSADWGVIERRLREGVALILPDDTPARVTACAVEAVTMTDSR